MISRFARHFVTAALLVPFLAAFGFIFYTGHSSPELEKFCTEVAVFLLPFNLMAMACLFVSAFRVIEIRHRFLKFFLLLLQYPAMIAAIMIVGMRWE